MMTLEFRSFDRNDWNANGGAEPAADGRDPIIAQTDDVEVIADNQGVEVHRWLFNSKGECVGMRVLSLQNETRFNINCTIAKSLTSFKENDLLDAGFEFLHEENWDA
jgi:hypothetical protein